jgi:hypothetical protein
MAAGWLGPIPAAVVGDITFRLMFVISWRREPTVAEQADGRHGIDDLR